MFKDKKIAVIVPALNEEVLILETLTGIPQYVDLILVIDDGSQDNTKDLIKKYIKKDCRVKLIEHQDRMGLGKSLIDGYLAALSEKSDVIAVMAGDNQMHPDDLETIISPICFNVVDYVKGNRLLNKDTWSKMPRYRFIGNSILSIMTKFATGYWKSIDPQCGYTAISSKMLSRIPISEMLKGYGYNANILYMLNLQNARVTDVRVRAIYDREKSKIKIFNYIWTVSRLLGRLFLKRLWNKHVVIDFHPFSLFYFMGFFFLICISSPLLIRIFLIYINVGYIPTTSLILFSLSFFSGIQLILHAISMDIAENKALWVEYENKE